MGLEDKPNKLAHFVPLLTGDHDQSSSHSHKRPIAETEWANRRGDRAVAISTVSRIAETECASRRGDREADLKSIAETEWANQNSVETFSVAKPYVQFIR